MACEEELSFYTIRRNHRPLDLAKIEDMPAQQQLNHRMRAVSTFL
jgi:hypothetical protein